METLTLFLVFASLTTVVFLLARRLMPANVLETTESSLTLVQPPVFGGATGPLSSVIPLTDHQRDKLRKDLIAAGQHRMTALEDFLAKRNLAFLVSIVATAALFALGVADGYEWIVGIVGGAVCLCVYCLPRVLLSGKATGRRREIEKSIPDAMDMIAMALNSGLPILHAIEKVETQIRKLYPALATELRIVTRQSQSGCVQSAFDGFAKRIDLPEVVAWCAMMRQSQRLGGQLTDSLSQYASRIRADRQNRAERQGNTASLKLLLPVVLCLAPPVGVLLVGPAVIEFRDFINRNKDETQNALKEVNLAQE